MVVDVGGGLLSVSKAFLGWLFFVSCIEVGFLRDFIKGMFVYVDGYRLYINVMRLYFSKDILRFNESVFLYRFIFDRF